MQSGVSCEDRSWSSSGLGRGEAIGQWRDWASQTLAPIDVRVPREGAFAARWASRRIGGLHFIQMGASAQSVVHPQDTSGPAQHEPTFQLVYSRRGSLRTKVDERAFTVRPGEFVLLDNTRFYQMEMDEYHEAVDLVMPRVWLEPFLPDPEPFLGRPFSARKGWGAPLGAMLDTMAEQLDGSTLPRALVAEQVGSLLSLASGFYGPAEDRRADDLTRRILALIERCHEDPALTLDIVAQELGVSKRYIHALLARTGSSFVQTLNAARLDKAADLLADPRSASLPVAEIGWRCGFLDPGYFARLFRRRFDVSPRAWRARRLGA
jgi:AraC-like DNA-binding protein